MRKTTYIPRPIDTSKVLLSKEICEMGELLARNTHETWAAQRLADGWKYGEQRDDVNKLHPCLIPYEELSEEEKEYDRRTAMEALKTLVALGFEIHKKQK